MDVREPREDEAPAIRAVVEAAFGQPDEAELVEALRADPGGPVALELVALDTGGEIIGHILLSWLAVEGREHAALALAPLSVAPAWQRCGVGSALTRAALERADVPVTVLGHRAYYPRFGFTPARALGFAPPEPWPDDAWLAVVPPGVAAHAGRVRFPAPFGLPA